MITFQPDQRLCRHLSVAAGNSAHPASDGRGASSGGRHRAQGVAPAVGGAALMSTRLDGPFAGGRFLVGVFALVHGRAAGELNMGMVVSVATFCT